MFINATITSPTGIVRVIADDTSALRATPTRFVLWKHETPAEYVAIRAVTWASLSAWERRDIA